MDQVCAACRNAVRRTDFPAQKIAGDFSGHAVCLPDVEGFKGVIVIVNDNGNRSGIVCCNGFIDGQSFSQKLRYHLFLNGDADGADRLQRCLYNRNRVAVVQILPGNVIEQIIRCLDA